MCLGLWKATAVNSKLNLVPCVDSETETDSSKYVAKEYNRCTDKVKNTFKQEIFHFYFHLTHILEISRFEVPISRFFWAFFQHLQICMFWRLAGLLLPQINHHPNHTALLLSQRMQYCAHPVSITCNVGVFWGKSNCSV